MSASGPSGPLVILLNCSIPVVRLENYADPDQMAFIMGESSKIQKLSKFKS